MHWQKSHREVVHCSSQANVADSANVTLNWPKPPLLPAQLFATLFITVSLDWNVIFRGISLIQFWNENVMIYFSHNMIIHHNKVKISNTSLILFFFLKETVECVKIERKRFTPLEKGLKNREHKEMKLKSSDVDWDNDRRMRVCAARCTHGDIYERRRHWLSKSSVSLKLWLLTSLQSLLDIWREAGS